jgi:hypothetical protein
MAEFAAVAALSDEGGGEHFLTFAGAEEEANRIFEEQGLVWGDRDDDRGGGLSSVRGIRFEEASSVDGCSCCVTDGIPHGVEKVDGGGGKQGNGKVVNCVIGSGGGKVEGREGVVFNG